MKLISYIFLFLLFSFCGISLYQITQTIIDYTFQGLQYKHVQEQLFKVLIVTIPQAVICFIIYKITIEISTNKLSFSQLSKSLKWIGTTIFAGLALKNIFCFFYHDYPFSWITVLHDAYGFIILAVCLMVVATLLDRAQYIKSENDLTI